MITEKRIKGDVGEKVACTFLGKEGFKILNRNYLKKWGELDIIAEKDRTIHFFEVKSMIGSVSDTISSGHRLEDNVHGLKVKHISRMIETYLDEKGRGLDAEFQFHILCVYMNPKTRRARVEWLENVIL